MEAGSGSGPDDLTHFRQLIEDPTRYHLFHALRVIEARYRDAPRLGESRTAAQDRVRLGQLPELAFPAATLTAFHPESDGKPGKLSNLFFGLWGPHGPLPLHMTEYARDRLRNHRDPTLVAFADMLTHRAMSLLYRVWASSQPAVAFDRAWVSLAEEAEAFLRDLDADAPLGSHALSQDPLSDQAFGVEPTESHALARDGASQGAASAGAAELIPEDDFNVWTQPRQASTAEAEPSDAASGGLGAAQDTGAASLLAEDDDFERTVIIPRRRPAAVDAAASPQVGAAQESGAPAQPHEIAGSAPVGLGADQASTQTGPEEVTSVASTSSDAASPAGVSSVLGVGDNFTSGAHGVPSAHGIGAQDVRPDDERTVIPFPRSARVMPAARAATPVAATFNPFADEAVSVGQPDAVDPFGGSDWQGAVDAAANAFDASLQTPPVDPSRREALGGGSTDGQQTPEAGVDSSAERPAHHGEVSAGARQGNPFGTAASGRLAERSFADPTLYAPLEQIASDFDSVLNDPALEGEHGALTAPQVGTNGDTNARGGHAHGDGAEEIAPLLEDAVHGVFGSEQLSSIPATQHAFNSDFDDFLELDAPHSAEPAQGTSSRDDLAKAAEGGGEDQASDPQSSGLKAALPRRGGDVVDVLPEVLKSFTFKLKPRPRRAGHLDLGKDALQHKVAALTGYADPSMLGADAMPDVSKRFFAGLLSSGPKNAEGLRAILEHFFEAKFTIQQFVGQWLTLEKDDTWQLGYAQLGRGTSLGRQVWSRDSKFRIQIGPLDLKDYQRLLPGQGAIERMEAIVRNYVGDRLAWDVQLILKAEQVPKATLGHNVGLGYNSWMGGRIGLNRDADDLILTPPSQTKAARALAGH